jgi:site-specific DNA-methyltransferase (adenine-specific)
VRYTEIQGGVVVKSKLYYGDNLDIMREHIADESVDLCYIDPPFNSNRNYNQIYNNEGTEDVAQSVAFVDKWEWNTASELYLDEIMLNERRILPKQTVSLIRGLIEILGKGSMLAYLVSMTVRIAEIHRVLKPTGSFYLHCDPTMSHYLKLVLDAIFCGQGGHFLNEIIWCYRKWSAAKKRFCGNHDTIFFYSKGNSWIYNQQYAERAESTLKRFGNKKIQSAICDETGKRVPSEMLDEISDGVKMGDWWEVSIIAPSSKERLGYSTQKPEKLLERIIKTSSNKASIVLDAYCGCGTTVAVAQRFGRKWMGIDISYQSIALIKKRLADSYGASILDEIEIKGIPKDMPSVTALVKNPADKARKEFEKWSILTYTDNMAMINEKKGGDGGVDGRFIVKTGKGEYKDILFSVKSGKVNPKSIDELNGTVERENAIAGVFITLERPTKGMLERAAAAGIYKDEHFPRAIEKIKIVTAEDILNGEKLNVPHMVDSYKRAQEKEIKEYEQTELC